MQNKCGGFDSYRKLIFGRWSNVIDPMGGIYLGKSMDGSIRHMVHLMEDDVVQ